MRLICVPASRSLNFPVCQPALSTVTGTSDTWGRERRSCLRCGAPSTHHPLLCDPWAQVRVPPGWSWQCLVFSGCAGAPTLASLICQCPKGKVRVAHKERARGTVKVALGNLCCSEWLPCPRRTSGKPPEGLQKAGSGGGCARALVLPSLLPARLRQLSWGPGRLPGPAHPGTQGRSESQDFGELAVNDGESVDLQSGESCGKQVFGTRNPRF